MGHIFFSRLGPLFQLKIYQELIVRIIPFTKWHDDYQSRCYTFYKNGDILLNNGSFLETYMLQCVKQNSASIAQYIIMYWSYLLRIFPVMKKKPPLHCLSPTFDMAERIRLDKRIRIVQKYTVPRCTDPPCRLFRFRFYKLSVTSVTFCVPVGA